MNLDLGSFTQDTLVRAIKTFCQSLAALLVADQTDLMNTAWGDKLSVAGMAALLSVLLTVASGLTTSSPAIGEAVTPDPQVVAKVDSKGGAYVAADASPLANDTPVAVTPLGDPSVVVDPGYNERGYLDGGGLIGTVIAALVVVILVVIVLRLV